MGRWYGACGQSGMMQFIFRSLIVVGAFLFFGGYIGLPGDSRAFAVPQLACDADLAGCRLGDMHFDVGSRSPLLTEIAVKARGNPAADLRVALTDPQVLDLLDRQVVPDAAVAYARTRLAAAVFHFIDGIEAGRATRSPVER